MFRSQKPTHELNCNFLCGRLQRRKRLTTQMRISMFALILNSIRVFPEAIKRGICGLFLSNEDGERSATSVSTYLFSAEGKGKRSSNFWNTKRQRTFKNLHLSFNWSLRFVGLASDKSVLLICRSVNGEWPYTYIYILFL